MVKNHTHRADQNISRNNPLDVLVKPATYCFRIVLYDPGFFKIFFMI